MSMSLAKIVDEMEKRYRSTDQYTIYPVYDFKVIPMVGMKSILYKGVIRGSSGEYPVTFIFEKVEYSDTPKSGYNPIEVDGVIKYYKVPSYTSSPVKCKCTCPDYRFSFEFSNEKVGSLIGKHINYTKVAGSTRGPRNPGNVPGLCLTGDTKISLLDGREVPIKDLIGLKEFYVYSYDMNTNSIVPGRAHSCRITGLNKDVLSITLDNGEIIKCTPEHKILLKGRKYKEAKDLKIGDSLMPLYREVDDNNYELVIQPSGLKEYTHRIVYKWKYGSLKNCPITHHNTFDKRNNNPSAITAVSWENHGKYHGKKNDLINDILHNKNNPLYSCYENSRERMKRNWSNPVRNKMISDRMKINNPIFDPCISEKVHKAAQVAHKDLLGKGIHNFQINHPMKNSDKALSVIKTRIMCNFIKLFMMKLKITEFNYNNTRTKATPCWESITNYYNSTKEAIKVAILDYKKRPEHYSRRYKDLIPFNHKIVSITLSSEKEDVYDFTVDTYHNFALSAGVFVHNCKHLYSFTESLLNSRMLVR